MRLLFCATYYGSDITSAVYWLTTEINLYEVITLSFGLETCPGDSLQTVDQCTAIVCQLDLAVLLVSHLWPSTRRTEQHY